MKHPPTLTVDADALINECELAEMSPNSQDELLPVSVTNVGTVL